MEKLFKKSVEFYIYSIKLTSKERKLNLNHAGIDLKTELGPSTSLKTLLIISWSFAQVFDWIEGKESVDKRFLFHFIQCAQYLISTSFSIFGWMYK